MESQVNIGIPSKPYVTPKPTMSELIEGLTKLLADKDELHIAECKRWYNLGVEVGKMMKGEK